MNPTLKKFQPVLQFLGITGVLCLVYYMWFVPNVWALPVIGKLYGYGVHVILLTLGEASVFILNTMGFNSWVIDDPAFEPLRYIDMEDAYMNVYIKNVCLGIDTMAVFTFLILGFPGKWLDRLWFIPLGVLGIHMINILRITGLCLAMIHSDERLAFDHHTVFNIVAMIFIFGMFVVWVKRSAKAWDS